MSPPHRSREVHSRQNPERNLEIPAPGMRSEVTDIFEEHDIPPTAQRVAVAEYVLDTMEGSVAATTLSYNPPSSSTITLLKSPREAA
jgi:hypothetical protein